jgi:negative regulator of sigma E activity
MNDQHSQMMDLERSLRALAEEDCHVQALPHVHAAVMQAWDSSRPSDQHRRRWRSRGAGLSAIGSIAAAVLVVVFMYRAASEPNRPAPVAARAGENARAVASVPRADRDTPADAYRPRPPRPRRRREAAPLRYKPGLVLVADPILDASAMRIVRVRVPRTALATLGIPLVEPTVGGTVELEMLVGEDGVARTIRPVVPVALRRE